MTLGQLSYSKNFLELLKGILLIIRLNNIKMIWYVPYHFMLFKRMIKSMPFSSVHIKKIYVSARTVKSIFKFQIWIPNRHAY